MSNDIELAKKSLKDIQNTQLEDFVPEHTVTTTIVDMIKSRISRFDKEDEFNEELIETLRTRMAEATWREVADFVLARQANENTKLISLLTPFLPKDGDRVPLIDQERQSLQSSERIFQKGDKETIKAFESLTRYMAILAKEKRAEKAEDAEFRKD